MLSLQEANTLNLVTKWCRLLANSRHDKTMSQLYEGPTPPPITMETSPVVIKDTVKSLLYKLFRQSFTLPLASHVELFFQKLYLCLFRFLSQTPLFLFFLLSQTSLLLRLVSFLDASNNWGKTTARRVFNEKRNNCERV